MMLAVVLGMQWSLQAVGLEPERFPPIAVKWVDLPTSLRGEADVELTRGVVHRGWHTMTAPASHAWRVAYLFPHMKDPYWLGCDYGVLHEARRLGLIADIYVSQGYDDLLGQLRQMDEVVSRRYDAIVLSPIGLSGDNVGVAEARKQGIPVFELANDSTSPDLTLKVTTSLQGMGSKAMQWIVQDARVRGLTHVNLLVLPGPRDTGWVKGEVSGTLAEIRREGHEVHILSIAYGDSDRIIQARLAAQAIARYGRRIDYILGCSGCAPAALMPLREAGLERQVRVVAYDLTREIADLVAHGDIAAAVDTKAVSQARVVTDRVVDYLEHRPQAPASTLLVDLGLVDRQNLASYPLATSIAPESFTPSYAIRPERY